MQSNETPLETNYRLQITFNFHVHHQIVLQVAENVAQNESFVLSKVTPVSKVTPIDGTYPCAICRGFVVDLWWICSCLLEKVAPGIPEL